MAAIKSSPLAFSFDPVVERALGVIAVREGRSKANMLEWLIRGHYVREGLGWSIEGRSLADSQSAIQVGLSSKGDEKFKAAKAALAHKAVKRTTKKSNTDKAGNLSR